MNKIALGIRIVGLSVIFAVAVGCSEKAEEVAAKPAAEETEMERAERELAEEKKKLAMMAEANRIAEEKAIMQAKLDEAKKQEDEARKKRLKEERENELAAIRKKKLIEKARAALEGTKIPSLTTVTGTTYKLVEINKVTPGSLGIIHDGGAAKVPLADLSDEWQKKAHFDPVEAEKYAQDRASREAQYKKAVAASKQADHAREQASTGKKKEPGLISAEEKKLQAHVEKYVNLKQKTQVELTRAFAKRRTYTRNSANWNTVDKKIAVLQNKVYEYAGQARRYRDLLDEKERASAKLKRARRDEERRKAREADRARRK